MGLQIKTFIRTTLGRPSPFPPRLIRPSGREGRISPVGSTPPPSPFPTETISWRIAVTLVLPGEIKF